MKCLIFLLLVTVVHADMRKSCLKANDVCKGSDFSVEEFILCGESPEQNFSVDTSILAPKGSGYMRDPDQCDGICVDVMSKEDKKKLICSNAVNVDIWNCSNYKSAMHCVADTGSIIMYAGIGLVILIFIGCFITHKSTGPSENCEKEQEQVAEFLGKFGKKKDGFKPMKISKLDFN